MKYIFQIEKSFLHEKTFSLEIRLNNKYTVIII